ncbi:MAG: glycosyltransferase [Flavobacteriales bacterium]|nr:glycosyltransferase [Flavobacteriales bacterium]
MSGQPVVSIITVVYNASAVIDRTMRSVAAQTWPEIEHIIIDGVSKDDTLEKVAQYLHPNLHVFSEPDKGIYDAMNKGIRRATGDYIIFMNAGDEFYSPDVLQKILSMPEGDFYYGNTMVVDDHGKELGERRLHPPKNLNWKSLQFGMCVSHQSILVKRSICVSYDLNYKISGDIDWTIRVLKNAKNVIDSGIFVSKFLEGGVSTSKRKQGLKERFAILSHHYGIVRTIFNHMFILLRFIWHKLTRNNMT